MCVCVCVCVCVLYMYIHIYTHVNLSEELVIGCTHSIMVGPFMSQKLLA